MDIEKTYQKLLDEIYPNRDKLIISEEEVTAKVLDAEDDILECLFVSDYTVHINTEELSYIALDLNTLHKLEKLILQAEDYFNKED